MTTSAAITDVIKELKKLPMTKEQLDQTKARILHSRADAEANDPVLKIAKMTQNCIEDIKERLAYITERREQRALEQDQKISSFAAALAERNKVKEEEKTTKQGQKTHRTRIEVWRDEVKQLAVRVERKPVSGTTALKQQGLSRQSTAKRPLESEPVFFEPLCANTSTPINKRIKTAAQNDSSSLVAPPTSSKKSVPWLSTRASMADEDVFADEDRHFPNPRLREKKKNTHDHNENNDRDHDDADEEINREDHDANSEDSYGSELTELEQMLTVEMAMVGVMTMLLARNNEVLRDSVF
ncbi:hypothetical protein E4T52_13988 [Aureobasidium sp. EXF-3400]|nr:hypothetical protein E4T51_11823 [Aureobasidium sp. EXF-12344]KAI4771006.1 hypothetical protein E4T52_13988 [Aureobasidium sp. EXF-3400]